MQQAKLYVGNLNYSTTDADLQSLFQKYGEVKSASVVTDKYSGRSKGFGFVEMASAEDAEKALAENGTSFMGRSITVSEARPPKPREGGFQDRGERRGGGGFGKSSYDRGSRHSRF